VIWQSSSVVAAIVEPRTAILRVCSRMAVQNGPNQGFQMLVQV